MGKIRRGGYIFITRLADHDPYHVHIYRDNKEVCKFDLEKNRVMEGKINRKILIILMQLKEEKKL